MVELDEETNKRRLHRLPATKSMTVDLLEPFTWPWSPETDNQRELASAQGKDDMDLQDDGKTLERKAEAIRIQAERLLSGEDTWKPSFGKDLDTRPKRKNSR